MKPISYKVVPGGYKFVYSDSELKQFHKYGTEIGGNGFLLMSFIDNKSRYEGYGTIEAPLKELTTIVLERCVAFDGEFSLDKIMNPPATEFDISKYRLVIMDETPSGSPMSPE